MKFNDDQLKQLKEEYIILPRSLIHLWGILIGVALAVLGVTSFVSFKDTVASIAAKTAEEKATRVAETNASNIARDRAKDVVANVFASAITSAQAAASEAARLSAADQVKTEARKAADEATKAWIQTRAGSDVVTSLQQSKEESDRHLAAIRAAESNLKTNTLTGMNLRLGALENKIEHPEEWQSPTLLPGVRVHEDISYSHPAFYKDALGVVHLRGLLRTDGGSDLKLFRLPEAYSPLADSIHIIMSEGTTQSRVNVSSKGEVALNFIAKGKWASLDGVSFRAR